jgi:hypothetical protein
MYSSRFWGRKLTSSPTSSALFFGDTIRSVMLLLAYPGTGIAVDRNPQLQAGP